MRNLEGVVTGIVKEIDAAQAQVKLEFPWLHSAYRSNWAPIASSMCGDNRGLFMMPEEDDEVLVAFEQGNVDHPFVIGFLWNGVDRAPESGTGASVRRLRTVSGHVLEFDDRAGQERILIKTQGGHEIEMDDGGGEAQISIKTSGGQGVTLKDQPSSITARLASGHQVVVDATGVTVSASSGVVTLDCVQATINATAILSVNAPIAQFSGVVQATTVVATAYTTAPGNTLGL